jgi:hypothetical protein
LNPARMTPSSLVSTTAPAGFVKLRGQAWGVGKSFPLLCSLDFAAYDLRGIHLERTQTLAQGRTVLQFSI